MLRLSVSPTRFLALWQTLQVGAALASLPPPILGGILLVVLGLLATVGLSTLKYADMTSNRNLVITGVAFMSGLAIPTFMKQHGHTLVTGRSPCCPACLAMSLLSESIQSWAKLRCRCVCVCLSAWLPACLPVSLFVCLPVCLTAWLPDCPSVRPFTRPSTSLLACLSVGLSVCIYVCMSL